ncbi:DUF2383 domain-containing protein [uncultured Clostridium sp.]|uniref:DUF2383 domain-containing protein n=1 Tax=uncultured Clostridium sp. TaxID=59620 RepID=UPI0026217A45|nr:DUF2383 domain-containing protein [uncultured Clostridium sp.]
MNNDIKEMNKFLKGIHMGGATFKDYLGKVKDPELKKELSQIIESFKRHEDAITNRIEKLGGNATDTLGIIGTMAEVVEKIKLVPASNDVEVCKHVEAAIKMGIKQGNKFIEQNKDLDDSLMREVKAVVSDYDIHLRKVQDSMYMFK